MLGEHIELKAKDVMTAEPVSVRPGATIRELARVLEENDISGVPVVDQGGTLVGVVSKTDLIRRCTEGTADLPPAYLFQVLSEQGGDEEEADIIAEPLVCVEDFMTVDPVTAAPGTPVEQVARLMFEKRIHRVIVVDHEKYPVGIITSLDLLGTLRAKAWGEHHARYCQAEWTDCQSARGHACHSSAGGETRRPDRADSHQGARALPSQDCPLRRPRFGLGSGRTGADGSFAGLRWGRTSKRVPGTPRAPPGVIDRGGRWNAGRRRCHHPPGVTWHKYLLRRYLRSKSTPPGVTKLTPPKPKPHPDQPMVSGSLTLDVDECVAGARAAGCSAPLGATERP